MTILLTEEKHRVTYETLLDYVLELWHKYEPICKCYVDSSQVAFIKSLKMAIGEPSEYMDQIKQYRSQHMNYQLNMRVEPCFFTTANKQSMLSALKAAFESGFIRIHPQFDKLWQALYQCSDVEGIIEGKQSLPGNDILDSLCMSMGNYER